MALNSRQERTRAAIFADPVRADIPWSDIESLFRALGATITQGSGSRVRVRFGGLGQVFHRPHPERVTDRGAVRSVRTFLTSAGFAPIQDREEIAKEKSQWN